MRNKLIKLAQDSGLLDKLAGGWGHTMPQMARADANYQQNNTNANASAAEHNFMDDRAKAPGVYGPQYNLPPKGYSAQAVLPRSNIAAGINSVTGLGLPAGNVNYNAGHDTKTDYTKTPVTYQAPPTNFQGSPGYQKLHPQG